MNAKPCLAVLGLMVLAIPAAAKPIEYLAPVPLTQVVKGPLQPVKGANKLFVITWGGDVAPIVAKADGLFQNEGLNFDLILENNFPKQVEAVLAGETPYLRGTLGMISSAAEVFHRAGCDLIVVHQLTWSRGGDCLVVRSGIRQPSDLRGKTIALQLYGPHMDYVLNVLRNAGLDPSSVKFKWLRELTLPASDTGKTVDPVSAFREDSSLDAVLCISPDALTLTSGGKVGDGSSGSVKGAHILLSTKTAARVIADVYAVRSDYAAANPEEVAQHFPHALLLAQENLGDLLSSRGASQDKYRQLLSKSADLLFEASQMTTEVEGLLGDCEFVGYSGNVGFFTGKGTTRSLETLNGEIQPAFVGLGLLGARVPLKAGELDFAALATGLRYATNIPVAPKFDEKKVAARVEHEIQAEPEKWEKEGTLFTTEILFGPNEQDFSEQKYAADFKVALDKAQTNPGALVVIEGHSDPLGVLRAKQDGKAPQEISQMEQAAKNLSLKRANTVKSSFLTYCKKHGFQLDESNFVATGRGISAPKFNPPRTKEEWAANRRVVFTFKNVEAEADEFKPLSNK